MYVNEINPVPASMDMENFDGANAARVTNEHLKTITDPRRRKILINLRDHALAESMGDYEALMATCSRKTQNYVVHATSKNDFVEFLPQNYEELELFYKGLIDLNMYVFHSEMKKLVVGDDEILLDVSYHQIISGENAVNLYGIKEADLDSTYEVFSRIWLIFIFDEDGMGCGEHSYSGGTTIENLRKLEDDEIPQEYKRGPRKIAEFFEANPDLDWPVE